MSKTYTYLFGPVPSRRLGRSLGVDLIPFKTCTMNCTYCQLGETACPVSDRGDYVPIQDVLAELEQWKQKDGRADHITLAGSGEPTLHCYFGDVFRWAAGETDIPTVLLTNGTLLHDPDVRAQAALADKVKVTLSAWDEASFQQIHRPAQGITFELLVQGEQAFSEQFGGELSVEVFIVDGVNSGRDQVQRIAGIVHSLNPDRIDLNTAVRPPAVTGIAPTPPEQLQALAGIFGEKAHVAASFKKQGFVSMELDEAAVLSLIKRHPATATQLAEEFDLEPGEVSSVLEEMRTAGWLRMEERDGAAYYFHRDA